MEEDKKKTIEKNIDCMHVSICNTINMGNFESLKLEAGISIFKKDDITKNEIFEYAWEEMENEINKQINKFKNKKKIDNNIINKKNKSNKLLPTKIQINAINKLRLEKNIISSEMPKTFNDAAEEIKKLQYDIKF